MSSAGSDAAPEPTSAPRPPPASEVPISRTRSASNAAPHFAAQPPHDVHSVRRISSLTDGTEESTIPAAYGRRDLPHDRDRSHLSRHAGLGGIDRRGVRRLRPD